MEWGWETEESITGKEICLSYFTVMLLLRRSCKVNVVLRLKIIHLVPYGPEWHRWCLNVPMALQFQWLGLSKREACKAFSSQNEGTSPKKTSIGTISGAPNYGPPLSEGPRSQAHIEDDERSDTANRCHHSEEQVKITISHIYLPIPSPPSWNNRVQNPEKTELDLFYLKVPGVSFLQQVEWKQHQKSEWIIENRNSYGFCLCCCCTLD